MLENKPNDFMAPLVPPPLFLLWGLERRLLCCSWVQGGPHGVGACAKHSTHTALSLKPPMHTGIAPFYSRVK